MSKRASWLAIVFAVGLAAGAVAMWAFQRRQAPAGGSDTRDHEEKLASLISDLQTIRSQLELYQVQHGEYPNGITGWEWIAQLTSQTDVRGRHGTDFGPYLSSMPANPFNGSCEVLVDTDGTIAPGTRRTRGWRACGWHFNAITGRFSANDSPERGRL
jgi:hypothetical protein